MGIAVQPTTESEASRHPVTVKSEMDVPIVTVDAGRKGSGGRGAPQRDRGGKSANWSAGGASDANNPFAALAALKQGKSSSH